MGEILEKEQIKKIFKFESEDVKLEVGGKPMTVSLETLQTVEGSTLGKMFSGKHEVKKNNKGEIVLDRDFDTFNLMINYLRNNRAEYPAFESGLQSQAFEQELDFWDVKTSNLEIEEKRLRSKINPDLVDFFDSEPSKACMEAKKKWRELGLFRFEEIERLSTNKVIEFDAKFGKSVKFSHFAGQLIK